MNIFTKLQLSTVGEFTLTITIDHITMVDSNMDTVYYRNRNRSFEYFRGPGKSTFNRIFMNQVDLNED